MSVIGAKMYIIMDTIQGNCLNKRNDIGAGQCVNWLPSWWAQDPDMITATH